MKTLPFNQDIYKIILSAPVKGNPQGYTRGEIVSDGVHFQASLYTATQVFHTNLAPQQVEAFVHDLLGTTFMQYTAWDNQFEHQAKVTKKGKLLTNTKASKSPPAKVASFNKAKNHIIQEGEPIPALVDMGIFTKDYKIITSQYDKLQQINRFIELLADETKAVNQPINIVDFGCGKSYLTFLVYHYFAHIRKLDVNICGLDLKADVIKNCIAAAAKYGYTNLKFNLGDIKSQAAPPVATWGAPGTCNIVISLHACDTATDHAIYNAINWGADLIYAAPCCQHELRKQITAKNIFTSYGIIEERMAALATDAIRAKLLEHVGYKAQIIEFTSMEHTPKNLLIRARKGSKNPKALGDVEAVMGEYGFMPTLYGLLV